MSIAKCETGRPVVVRLCIEALAFSVLIGFPHARAFEIARESIFGRLSGARLPHTTYELAPGETPTLLIAIEPRTDGQIDVQFHGEVESPAYSAARDGFHWDFSKVLNALVMRRSLGSGLVPLHGACLGTPSGAALLLGASGAGKSSTAYAALLVEQAVYASELGFVRGDVLKSANSALTMDRGTIDRFRLSDDPIRDAGIGPKYQIELAPRAPVTITELYFVQVTDGDARTREITERRARMLMFENVVTQLPVTQLLCQETWPLWMPPSKNDVDAAMQTIYALSSRSPRIVEGHPAKIVELVCGLDSDPC